MMTNFRLTGTTNVNLRQKEVPTLFKLRVRLQVWRSTAHLSMASMNHRCKPRKL